jgi:hypothetical protein
MTGKNVNDSEKIATTTKYGELKRATETQVRSN